MDFGVAILQKTLDAAKTHGHTLARAAFGSLHIPFIVTKSIPTRTRQAKHRWMNTFVEKNHGTGAAQPGRRGI
jgi:hypothetical protein